jgi:D-glycero-beta-D-manno-heptose-7-phosphate kinase
MQPISEKKVTEILEKIKNKSVAIVGDIMLDRYFWGTVSRVSPEAPVPVIDIESETYHLGGAANVANNLQSLGVKPLLCGVVGSDNSGKKFVDIAKENGILTDGLFCDSKRPTTIKTRIIGNNQQIARLDRELRNPLSKEGEEHILNVLKNYGELSGLIFQDYNKGALTEFLIREITEFAKENNIPIFIDPKFENFFSFKHATVFKPNRKEAQQALGKNLQTHDDLLEAGNYLLKKLEAKNILLTLGKDGMLLFESTGNVLSVPTRARHVADVSGAGDTAIATLSAFIAGGASVPEASGIANYASGAVCEEPGIVPITADKLLNSIRINHNQ